MSDTTRTREESGTEAEPPAPATSAAPSGDSMFRNAYALMLSTGVSAALGLGFWLVAARYYTEAAVGQGSAAIAAMRLLASITATTMIGAVVRYVPRAGRSTGMLVRRAYAGSSVVVCVGCGIFFLTLDMWGPSYAPLGTLTAGLIFTGSCIAWAILTLQDGVLTGLRKAIWVPVGNAVFSIGKLLLLAVFATAMPVLGIFVSWAAAIGISVLPLGWLIFRKLIPRQETAEADREPPALREIGRFLAGDSVGALFSLAMINLVPVVVAVRFEAAQNGYFYIAYTVGGTMEYMAINMASSLTAHASHSPGRLAEGVRGALRRMAYLLIPVVIFLIVFAPQILHPFGAHYATHGTTVLRLLAAAALPRVIVELYIGVLRVQGRTGALALVQGTMCTLVLGSTVVLLGRVGINGAGWAVLTSMTAMSLACAVGLRRALANGAPIARTARGRDATSPAYGTRWARDKVEGRSAEFGTQWAKDTLVLRGVHDTATPALGIPVFVPDEPGTPTAAAPPVPEETTESLLTDSLWLLLGLAAGLFWVPLSRATDLHDKHLTGPQLIDALPPVTLTAAVLLIVVHSAAVSLYRARPALIVSSLLVTMAALHTAPLLVGIGPHPAAEHWHGAPASFFAEAAGMDSPAGVLRVMPVALQLLCLGLVAVLMRSLGAHWRITASAVWVLTVAGWAAQGVFAVAGIPVFLALFAVTGAVLAMQRYRGGTGWLK
ncbi:lipopolysaccharide biosynthesis protein [Streptomyces beijiangensis]|uniref:Lipopolysaccharide biosynthesis protein n=1 Tax=Streptomyces beijiangensis TaxID=163361 RepID=A0A939FAM1_9ACTN|nr:lipopolysaccharide biosynthesis protein [Streptomyces beijiangensis]MBO0515107.1 lipopolysaccharide biosynthesis protein [Streptomyces beijiangensis]